MILSYGILPNIAALEATYCSVFKRGDIQWEDNSMLHFHFETLALPKLYSAKMTSSDEAQNS